MDVLEWNILYKIWFLDKDELMAEYTGGVELSYATTPVQFQKGFLKMPHIGNCNSWFSSVQARGGTYSLALGLGGWKEVYYALDAGVAAISCYVYPLSGSNPRLEVLTLTGEVQDSDTPSSTGAWEELTLSFTAVKAVYKIRMANPVPILSPGIGDGVDAICYFDDLV